MKKLFILPLILMLLVPSALAVFTNGYFGEMEINSLTIQDGDSTEFTAVAYSIDPPLDVEVFMDKQGSDYRKTFFAQTGISDGYYFQKHPVNTYDYDGCGTYTIAVQGHDRYGSDYDTITLVVECVDQKPVLSFQDINVLEDQTETINLGDFVEDETADNEILWTFSGMDNVKIVRDGNNAIITPNANWFGIDTVTFTAEDEKGQRTSQDVKINVIAVNDAPVISQQNDITMNVGDSLVLHFTATDIENDALTFSDNTNLFDVDANTGYATLAPTQTGTYTATVTVTDGFDADQTTFTIKVEQGNKAPYIDVALLSPIIFNEDSSIRVTLNNYVQDEDVNSIVWSIVNNNNELNHDLQADELLLSGIRNWNGQKYITLTARDSEGLSTSALVLVSVTPVNDNPVITGPSYLTGVAGGHIMADYDATDIDSDFIGFSSSDKDNYEVDPATGGFEYFPTEADIGIHTFTVYATDLDGGQDSIDVTMEITGVVDVNHPPYITYSSPADDMFVGQEQMFLIGAEDPDGDQLTYEWFVDGQKVDREFHFYWFTANTIGAKEVKVVVSDGQFSVDYLWNFNVLEGAVNHPPVIVDYNPKVIVAEVGDQINFNVVAQDPDNDVLTYSWTLNGQVVSSTTSYLFNALSVGYNTVSVVVSDGEYSVTKTWNFKVREIVVNNPPVIVDYDPKDSNMLVGETQTFSVVVEDLDNDPISYQWLVDGVLVGFDETYDFTPNTMGTFVLQVIVSDGHASDMHTWEVVVSRPINHPPVIDDYNPKDLLELAVGEFEQFEVDASDADNDPLSYEWYINGDKKTPSYSWPYRYGFLTLNPGDYVITVVVSDGQASVSHTWEFKVVDENIAPEILSFSPGSPVYLNVGDAQRFMVDAIDPNHDTLTYTWNLEGAQTQAGNQFNFGATAVGTFTLTVTVSDGDLSVSNVWTIIVQEPENHAPEIVTVSPISPVTLIVGDYEELQITAIDADNDVLSYSWYVNGVLQNDVNNDFIFNANTVGDYNVKIVVSDGELTDSYDWFIEVKPVDNRAPYITLIDPNPAEDMFVGDQQMFLIGVEDPDGDQLTYEWFVDGQKVDREFHFYWFTANTIGAKEIKVVVSDGIYSLFHTWEFDVLEIIDDNHPPYITTIIPEVPSNMEIGDLQLFGIGVEDPDGDQLTYEWFVDGVKIDRDILFYWHKAVALGAREITVVVSDGEFEVSHTWYFTVVQGNVAPEIIDYSPNNPVVLTVGDVQEFWVLADDANNDVLTYSWELIETGSIVEGSSEIEFTATQVGTFTLVVEVSDGEFSDSFTWTIIVNEVPNSAPSILSFLPNPAKDMNLSEQQMFGVTAIDADGDELTYTWFVNGVQIDRDILFYWYTADFVGAKTVRVDVSDGVETVSVEWEFEVFDNGNHAPELNSYYPDPALDMYVGDSQSFGVNVVDPDGDTITYEWFVNNIAVGDVDSVFDYLADTDGVKRVRVDYTDGTFSGSVSWVFTVFDNVNTAPQVISYIPNPAVDMYVGDQQMFGVTAFDADGDNLFFTWYVNGIEVSSGFNHYWYTGDFVGAKVLRVDVSDGQESVSVEWHFNVLDDVNNAPQLVSYLPDPAVDMYVGDQQLFGVDVVDPDGDNLYYTWYVNGQEVSNGFNHYWFNANVRGPHTVRVDVTDLVNTISVIWSFDVLEPRVIVPARNRTIVRDSGSDIELSKAKTAMYYNKAGDYVDLLVSMLNDGPKKTDDLSVTIMILELGYKEEFMVPDLGPGDRNSRLISFRLPDDMPEGEYYIQVSANGGDSKRSKYVPIYVY